MLLFKKHRHKLAVIGNGFDLAHGYDTLYRSFASNTSSPALDEFRSLCESEAAIRTWYDFETNINVLSQILFARSYEQPCDFDENRKDVQKLNELFSEVAALLSAYLTNEVSRKPFRKLASVSNYLDTETVAINFNYTNTAEPYTRNVFYVHGSLRERDVLLGYDYREEGCLAQYEDMYWSKTFCRESLAFRRFLRRWRVFIRPEKRQLLLSALEHYYHCANTGRGLDPEVCKDIYAYSFIHWFISKERKRSALDRIPYSEITDLIILGHGIEADRVLLDDLFSKCTALKEIVVFRYDGESDEEFERKTAFLKPYCATIKDVYY